MHQSFFRKIRNHIELRNILVAIGKGIEFSWFDDATATICRRCFRLSQQHLRIAGQLAISNRNWRSTISRCYYAAYNASRSVRYLVSGFVKLDGEDHKHVGDLPDDFPDRANWSNFTVELRRDRNTADYEPWDRIRRSLTFDPDEALEKTHGFVRVCRDYLKQKGVRL
jgi:hypothetical protein